MVLEHFLTDTARYADVVLPATTQVEHVDLVPSWGHTYVTYNEPAIAPVGEALPNTEIFRRLARAMGFDAQPFEATDEELARAALAGARAPLDTIDFERLREVGWAEADLPEDFRPFAHGGFGTPSGRLRLWSDGLPPGYDPPPGDAEPLALMTVKSAHHFLNSTYANLPRHLAGEGEPLLEMHPDDAAPRGIADGDVVRLSNARGEVVARARLGDVVRPGVVALPSGWWASRSPGGTMANALTTPELTDRGGGGAFHSARVEVEPAARTGRRGHQHGKSSSGGPMSRSRLFKLALPAAVVLGAGTAVAIAAIPSASGVITACRVTTGTTPGQLRVIDTEATPPQACTHRRDDADLERARPARPAGRPRTARRLRVGHGHLGRRRHGSGAPFDTSQTGGPSADIFLAIDGIPGDSTDAQHKNQISIESFAFLAKRPSTRTVGAVRFSGLRLDKVYDVSSPRILSAATSGRHLKSATVTFSTGSDPGGTNVLTYKLSDVAVSSYEQGGANPDTKPLGSLEEEIGLSPARVQVTEKTFGANGNAGPPVTSSWQVPKSKQLEVAAAEDERAHDGHEAEVDRDPRQQQRAGVVRAAERAELDDRARDAGDVLHQLAQGVAVERLEGQRPRAGVGDRLQRVGVQRVADRAQQAGEQSRAEDHEHADPVGGRGEEDRAQQRERRHHDHREREAQAGADGRLRPPVAGDAGDHHGARVDDADVGEGHRRGGQEAPGQVLAAAEGAHDERLQQPGLGVAADRAESVRKTASTAPRKSVPNMARPSRVAPASVRASRPNWLSPKPVTSLNSSLAPHA